VLVETKLAKVGCFYWDTVYKQLWQSSAFSNCFCFRCFSVLFTPTIWLFKTIINDSAVLQYRGNRFNEVRLDQWKTPTSSRISRLQSPLYSDNYSDYEKKNSYSHD